MKEIIKTLHKFIFLFIIFFAAQAEGKVLSVGNSNAKVTVKVFSSLTCPHCANFHIKVFDKLKKDYIDQGLVKFEHHAFPLDLAALNAEVIVRCTSSNEKKFELLDEMYNQQKVWAVGSDINKINESIKKIGTGLNLSENNMNDCLKNSDTQDVILNQRIEAQKKYKIKSTPTIVVNEKEYTGKANYEKFKKIIEKHL
tara:strand:+ start:319 stop:912 length:594 start_codon:yes stop_codon:yes gene_type:complete